MSSVDKSVSSFLLRLLSVRENRFVYFIHIQLWFVVATVALSDLINWLEAGLWNVVCCYNDVTVAKQWSHICSHTNHDGRRWITSSSQKWQLWFRRSTYKKRYWFNSQTKCGWGRKCSLCCKTGVKFDDMENLQGIILRSHLRNQRQRLI